MTVRRPGAWRTAVALFTVVPVAAPTQVDRPAAGRALLWLPVVGLALGTVGGAVLYAVGAVVDTTAGRLLAAVLAVGSLACLTGGLHLDGLADTADGLGSRRPAADALAIMRRSDIGPMGVATLLFVALAQVTALATLGPGPSAAVALAAAVVVARVAVVLVAGVPGAREDGFGALVAGGVGRLARYGYVAAVLLIAALPAALGAPGMAARLVAAAATGLLLARLLAAYAARRLGGTTGDVYGAVVETSTTAVLLVLALTG